MPSDVYAAAPPPPVGALADPAEPVTGSSSLTFGVVVPVKPRALAKSRLSSLGDAARRELVVAFAVDTVVAAAGCDLVRAALVVTDDAALARTLAGLGVAAVPDGDIRDLNATLRQGAAEVVRRAPGVRPVALCADLPALRPGDLAAVLSRAPVDRAAFLADAAGTGTTLYTAPDLPRFEPRFGTASRAEHHRAGATEILGVGAESVRRDVDLPDDLPAAAALGLGPRSRAVVLRHGLARADG